MRKKRRLLSVLLVMAMVLALIPGQAFAATVKDEYVTKTAKFPGYDFTFGYNDEWFTESSFDYNPHLSTLSMLTAMETDTLQIIKSMLEAMGFKDVEGNGYYGLPNDKPESIGVVAGKKMITVDGDKVPLIAIVVRGCGYDLEWYGNFIIGNKGIHDNFKKSADEAIRFVNAYAKKEGIEGEAKIWITGHSRAAGVANLVAGYYAMSGDEDVNGFYTYPGDVYGYLYATPGTVVDGKATYGELLSVSAARTDEAYAEDTPGEAYDYTGSDKDDYIDPDDTVFDGIHNITPSVDLIPKLPPDIWNYTVLGPEEEKDYIVDQEAFLYYLELVFGKQKADDYKKYGGPESLKWLTLDLGTLTLVEDKTATESASQDALFNHYVHELAASVGDVDSFTENYQEVLASMAGLFSGLQGKLVDALMADKMTLIKTGVLAYISYVKEWFKEHQQVELSDGEAAELVVATAVSMLTGQNIDPKNFTIDDLLYYLCVYFSENTEKQFDPNDPTKIIGYTHKSKLVELLHTTLAKVVNNFTGGEDADLLSGMNTVYSMLYSGAYGFSGTPETATGKEDGKTARGTIMGMIGMGVSSSYPEIFAAISESEVNHVSVLMDAALPIVKEVKHSDGSSKVYDTAEEAADAMIAELFTTGLINLAKSGKVPATGFDAETYKKFAETIAKNPEKVRRVLLGTLLGADNDTFSIPMQIRNAATLIGQISAIFNTHVVETYAAWMLSQDDLYPIIINTIPARTYNKSLNVELIATEGAEMYYTLDGEDPTLDSEKYTGPIVLKQTKTKQEITLKVIAVRNGRAGGVWEYSYVIKAKETSKDTEDEDEPDPEEDPEEDPEPTPTPVSGKWLKTSDGWKYLQANGSYAESKWLKISGKWYYFDDNAIMEQNAYRNGWYVANSGAWDGNNDRACWKKNSKGWWYSLPDGSYLKSTWKKINGKWYYFKADGYMAEDEYVNGYYVGKDGAWIDLPRACWKKNSKGWWYGDEADWYAQSETLIIDGTARNFDDAGYCTNPYGDATALLKEER